MTAPKLQAPIVLVHGLLGYDQLKVCGWTMKHYFPGIPELLTAAGNRVLVPRLSPTCGVAERAQQLKEFLDKEAPGEAVHLVGHSMGGLDCRYLISRLGVGSRVLTLTTIGTPHRGSAFADWGISRLERVLKPLIDFFGIPHQAFYDLTTERCKRFNDEVPDLARVRYFSVAGRFDGNWIDLLWQPSYRIVHAAEGPNDGVVSLASATYGEGIEIWEGDHLSLVNWPNPSAQARGTWRDRAPEYATLIERLKAEGF